MTLTPAIIAAWVASVVPDVGVIAAPWYQTVDVVFTRQGGQQVGVTDIPCHGRQAIGDRLKEPPGHRVRLGDVDQNQALVLVALQPVTGQVAHDKSCTAGNQ